jgi:hypothetical protein
MPNDPTPDGYARGVEPAGATTDVAGSDLRNLWGFADRSPRLAR